MATMKEQVRQEVQEQLEARFSEGRTVTVKLGDHVLSVRRSRIMGWSCCNGPYNRSVSVYLDGGAVWTADVDLSVDGSPQNFAEVIKRLEDIWT